jgi:hypothetical protein
MSRNDLNFARVERTLIWDGMNLTISHKAAIGQEEYQKLYNFSSSTEVRLFDLYWILLSIEQSHTGKNVLKCDDLSSRRSCGAKGSSRVLQVSFEIALLYSSIGRSSDKGKILESLFCGSWVLFGCLLWFAWTVEYYVFGPR